MRCGAWVIKGKLEIVSFSRTDATLFFSHGNSRRMCLYYGEAERRVTTKGEYFFCLLLISKVAL